MTLTEEERKTLEFEYGEVCRSHAATVDFRGKLLALLPIASGAALFLLLEQRDSDAPLAAIGIFGCAVTLGLFIYELRNIQECNELIRQGGGIEEALGVPNGMRRFKDKPKARLNGFLGATGAGWIVYTAIFCGWLYVALTESWLEASARWWLPVFFTLVLSARFAVWPRVRRPESSEDRPMSRASASGGRDRGNRA